MKTTINLADYDFAPYTIVEQINDHPETAFPRVAGFRGMDFDEIAKVLIIKCDELQLRKTGKKVIFSLAKPLLNDGRPWVVENDHLVVALDKDLNPLPNPDFDQSKEPSETNFPYLQELAFDMYYRLISKTPGINYEALLKLAISSDNDKNCFG